MKEDSFPAPRIWLVTPFSLPDVDGSPDRFRYIASELHNRGALVVQYISAFDHTSKTFRRLGPIPWPCVKIFELGYKRNLSAERLISHIVFSLALPFYLVINLLRFGKPDCLFVALPHNGAACVAAVFAKALRVRLIVDVHDTWPESILGVKKLSMWARPFYAFWKRCADFAFLCADDVFAESARYAERANIIRYRFGRSRAQAIYLGGDPAYYQQIQQVKTLPDELRQATFVVAYVGTLGENNDLDCILDAFDSFAKEHREAGLLFLGGGERESILRSGIETLGIRAWVSGRIPHSLLLAYLKCAKVGLNCFKAGGNVAYSYKLNDYLLSGVPVVNSLIGESADLIEAQGLGVNYEAGNPESLLAALRACHSQWRTDLSWGKRVMDFSSRCLNRRESYYPLIQSCLSQSHSY